MIRDNATRWNSYYTSIGRALNTRERITQFCQSHRPRNKDKTIVSNRLDDTHWAQLEHLHDALEVFYIATILTEGKQPLYKHFQTLDNIIAYCESNKHKFVQQSKRDKSYKWLAEASKASWMKAEKYFKLIDQTPIYYAAIVLNPTLKKYWFTQQWGSHPQKVPWIDMVMDLVKGLWESDYRDKFTTPANRAVAPRGTRPTIEGQTDDALSRFKESMIVRFDHSVPQLEVDALEEYLIQPVIPWDPQQHEGRDFDCITYWTDRVHVQPALARFALDTLAIPIMSDYPERTFSSAKLGISDNRNNLTPDVIEGIECLRDWTGKPVTQGYQAENQEQDQAYKPLWRAARLSQPFEDEAYGTQSQHPDREDDDDNNELSDILSGSDSDSDR